MTDGIHFARPLMLYLLWSLPVLAACLFLGARRRRGLLEGFAALPSLERIAPDASPPRRLLKAGLSLLALTALIVALAGPRWGYSWLTLQRSTASLVVALDCSRSMLAQDVSPERMQRGKREVLDLLDLLQGERVGLVAFAGTAFLQCPLTLDHGALRLFLSVLGPDYLPVGGTDLALALETALAAFDHKDPGDKLILLLTDGEATSPAARDKALKAANEAAAKGVRIFTIGVGSEQGAPVPAKEGGGFTRDQNGAIVHSRLDESLLRRIADIAGGAYLRSVSGDTGLASIYSQHMAGGETQETEERIQRFTDRYQWFVGLAFFLLLAEVLLSARKGGRFAPLLGCMLLLSLLTPQAAQAAGSRDLARQGLEAYERGDFATALERFLAAQAEDPDSPATAYNAGAAAYKNQNHAQALAQFQRAAQSLAQSLDQKPEQAELLAKSLYNQGNAAYRLGRLPEAVSLYEQALEFAPEDQETRLNLDFVRRQLERQEQEKQEPTDQDREQEDQEHKDQKQDDSGQEDARRQGEQESPERQPSPDEGEQEQDSGQSQEQNQDQGADQPEYDSSLDPEQLPEPPREEEPQAPMDDQEQPAPPSGEQPQPEQPQDDQPPSPPTMDDAMLNRLEDRPGRALMPRYDKRRIERDW
jgi:Ca-activated chloride channel homolog